MRIDRLLCELNLGTRSGVKELLKKGLVCVDGQVVKKADTQVNEAAVTITCQGRNYRYRPYVYYILNKPAGVVTSTVDPKDKTVMELFREAYEKQHGDILGLPFQDMFPVGRLDKDTVGLLLLTNDGELAHSLLSPKKHVKKRYYVELDGALSETAILQLEQGVDIGEEKLTLPAHIETEKEHPDRCRITITEGKFHQVKRMFQAVGLSVTYLKREAMGSLVLPESLCEGSIRELTAEEVSRLRNGV